MVEHEKEINEEQQEILNNSELLRGGAAPTEKQITVAQQEIEALDAWAEQIRNKLPIGEEFEIFFEDNQSTYGTYATVTEEKTQGNPDFFVTLKEPEGRYGSSTVMGRYKIYNLETDSRGVSFWLEFVSGDHRTFKEGTRRHLFTSVSSEDKGQRIERFVGDGKGL